MLPANLPPSLTDGSSSPMFSSPRTMMHSSLPSVSGLTPLKSASWQYSALHNLPSSPPDPSSAAPGTPAAPLSASLQPPYEPNRLESEHFAAAIARRKNAPPKTDSPPQLSAGLKRSLTEAELTPGDPKKLLPSDFPDTDGAEYGMRSGKFRFVVDHSGHVSVRSPERKAKKRNSLSSKEIDSILNADSDSESESEFGSDTIAANDAISAFARTLARSRVGQIENKKQRSRSSSQDEETLSNIYGACYPEREPRTPTSSGSADGCARISRLLQGSTATPPGAVFGFDAMNVYATGMTPYLPRS